MRRQTAAERRALGDRLQGRHKTELVTLLFTDVVGSTALKATLGDRVGVARIQQHHSLVRDTLAQFPDGEEISTAGDSFFLVFAKPSDAVRFALLLRSRVHASTLVDDEIVRDRIGIHIGEVVIEEGGGRAKDLHGLGVDTCARLMSLAKAGQILLTRAVFDNARQALRGEEIEGVGSATWFNHGPYLLKGLEEPVEICEVGQSGQAPFEAPATSEVAQRRVSADQESVLGWRPAAGQLVPNTQWVLEQNLGEGGFGEVWVGRHASLKEQRVFKFCFRADRVRFLKREVTLFRVLKERVGHHPNIVRLLDVCFDEPPFYAVMDYEPGDDLKAWCELQGGAGNVPLASRVEVVAQIADALQAAHDAGVIHRDVKPGNILVSSSPSGGRGIQAKLTDFGIGQVVSEEVLAGVTRAGFTETILPSNSSSHTGTHLYMAPELLAGRPASTRADTYSLGVVLYQFLLGDFSEPLTTDWVERVSDPLLREDLRHCFAGNPQERFAGAGQLAAQLRALEQRRAAVTEQKAEIARREKLAYRRGIVRAVSISAVILAIVAALAMSARHQSRIARRTALELELRFYVSQISLVRNAMESHDTTRTLQYLQDCPEHLRGWEWDRYNWLADRSRQTLRTDVKAWDVAYSPDGATVAAVSDDAKVLVWNVSEAKLRWEASTGDQPFTATRPGRGTLSVAFSPEGDLVATGGDSGRIQLWAAESGQEVRTVGHHDVLPDGKLREIWGLAFNPADGHTLATGVKGGLLRLWDVEASATDPVWSVAAHESTIWAVAFSPDGNTIVTGSTDGTVKLFEATHGKLQRTLEGHRGDVNCVLFSPDGKYIVSAADDKSIRVWDADTGNLLDVLVGHTDWVRRIAFSPDGRVLASVSRDRTLRLWNFSQRRLVATLTGHSDYVRGVAFSPEGKSLLTGGDDRSLKLWDFDSGDSIQMTLRSRVGRERLQQPVYALAMDADESVLISGHGDGLLRFWNPHTGQETKNIVNGPDPVVTLALSDNGRYLVTGERSMESERDKKGNQGARVWDLEQDKLLHHLPTASYTAAITRDGATFAVTEDKRVEIYSTENNRLRLSIETGHEGEIAHLTFSPDGNLIASASADHTVKVWNAQAGKLKETLRGHQGPAWKTAFSPDGTLLASSGLDGSIRLWEIAGAQVLFEHTGLARTVTGLAFHPAGHRLASGELSQYGTISLWDVATGQDLVSLSPRETSEIANENFGALDLMFNADGSTLIAATFNGLIRFFQSKPSPQLERVRRTTAQAAGLVDSLYEEVSSYKEVKERLLADTSLEATVRQEAARLAAVRIDPTRRPEPARR